MLLQDSREFHSELNEKSSNSERAKTIRIKWQLNFTLARQICILKVPYRRNLLDEYNTHNFVRSWNNVDERRTISLSCLWTSAFRNTVPQLHRLRRRMRLTPRAMFHGACFTALKRTIVQPFPTSKRGTLRSLRFTTFHGRTANLC